MVIDTFKTILVTACIDVRILPELAECSQSARRDVFSDRRSCERLGRASAARSQVLASK